MGSEEGEGEGGGEGEGEGGWGVRREGEREEGGGKKEKWMEGAGNEVFLLQRGEGGSERGGKVQ